MVHAVVMAGGSGTRFWPLSREARPKQLIAVAGDRTMLQDAVARLMPHVPPERIMVVGRAAHEAELRRQLADLPAVRIVCEPEGRDSAACIALAAALLQREGNDPVMAALPADQVIEPPERFQAALAQAEEVARREHALVTLGVPPRAAVTRYGYIERGEALPGKGEFRAYRIASFREKPDQPTAEEFVGSGRFYWNSGAFVWRVEDIVAALHRCAPRHYAAFERIAAALGTPGEAAVIAREYAQLEPISIDYAVMEKAGNAAVIEVDYAWDDLGSWDALSRLRGADGAGNTVSGTCCLHESKDCIVVSADDHLIGVVGAADLVIVHSPDATLVCRRDRLGEVKQLVRKLREHRMEQYL